MTAGPVGEGSAPAAAGAVGTDVMLSVRLAGARVVGVGAGPVAAAKLAPLLDAGAALTLVAPAAEPSLAAAAAAGRLAWRRRAYDGPVDLAGALLVVAATGDRATDDRVAADAAAAATVCVRSGSDPERTGSASFPAVVRRGPLTVAVATSGLAPALARRLRDELADAYGPEYGALAELLGQLRADPAVRSRMAQLDDAQRRAAWRALPLADILALLSTGSPQSAKELAAACLSSSSD